MPRKISVYVDEELHRALKAAATMRGMTLSGFMVEATKRALHVPDRRAVAEKMDRLRASLGGSFSAAELRSMREEGRRF